MKCSRSKFLIPLFLDDELDPQEKQPFQDHLAVCSHCLQELKKFEASWELLKNWKDIEPAPGYISRFWTELSCQRSWHQKVLRDLKENFAAVGTRRKAPAVVAAFAVILVGFFAARSYFQIQRTANELTNLDQEQIEFMENVELASDFEVIEELDILEDWEAIEREDLWGEEGVQNHNQIFDYSGRIA